ncbi:MAG: Gfo/Idh/MocA family protein [Candidatus Avispirillum sp.]
MKTVKFGLVGCGLMAREFASAAARWCHFTQDIPRPEIVGICSVVPAEMEWFKKNFPDIKYCVTDYKELLDKDDIEAIYCAVPHNLHEQFYIDIIKSGKALLGEKPFGIDKAANDNILKAYYETPGAFVRCCSEFPYYPAMQTMINWFNEGKFGKILEIHAGFNHCSDMDLNKPINWKRMVKFNGEYGCLGDLGIHTQHVPFRMGFKPTTVRAHFSNIVKERPDGKGGTAPCDTFDNCTLFCTTLNADGDEIPMTLETKRMCPGSTNRWFFEIYGMDCSARFSSDDANAFYYTSSWGKEQSWNRIIIGYKPMLPTITGPIFEFGFVDAIQQQIGAFMLEYAGEKVPFGLFTPEETALSHKLATAALKSHYNRTVEVID